MTESVARLVAGGGSPNGDEDLRLSVGRLGRRVAVDLHKSTHRFTITPRVARDFAAELLKIALEVEHDKDG